MATKCQCDSYFRLFVFVTPRLTHTNVCSWVRMSAQVWNELSDFEYVANLLVKCVEKLGDGSWKKQ